MCIRDRQDCFYWFTKFTIKPYKSPLCCLSDVSIDFTSFTCFSSFCLLKLSMCIILYFFVHVYINCCPIILGFKGNCWTVSAHPLPCCSCRLTFLVKLCCYTFFYLANDKWCCCRIRTETHGGAWCPKEQVSRDAHEYLQIDLGRLKVVTLVETQGRFGNGQVCCSYSFTVYLNKNGQ